MRQGANSAVRFTTYTTLKQFVQGSARPGQPIPTSITFGIGAIAGLVTVYTTMPLECVYSYLPCFSKKKSVYDCLCLCSVIKTRMQSIEARQKYRNSFHCGYRIFTEEGILRFWAGTTPRLTRLVVRLGSYLFFSVFHLLNVVRLFLLQMSGGIVFTVYEKMIAIIGGREES